MCDHAKSMTRIIRETLRKGEITFLFKSFNSHWSTTAARCKFVLVRTIELITIPNTIMHLSFHAVFHLLLTWESGNEPLHGFNEKRYHCLSL